MPGENSTTGSISLPFSTILLMLKTVRDCAIVRYTEVSASTRPGHFRRPKPNTKLSGSGSGSRPSQPRKRSGMNADGSWNMFGSRVEFLLMVSESRQDDNEMGRDNIRPEEEIEEKENTQNGKYEIKAYQILGIIIAPLGIRYPGSLLWYVVDVKQGNGKPSFRLKGKDYRSPTWSWASVEGEISIMGGLEEFEGITLATVLNASVNGGDQLGTRPVSGGRLHMRGPFGKATWDQFRRDTSAGDSPRLTSIVDANGTTFDHAVYNSVFFDHFDPAVIHDQLFCLVIVGEPASEGGREMLLVNGLLLQRLVGLPETYERVGTFSLGSLFALDLTPGYRNPTFDPLVEHEIIIV